MRPLVAVTGVTGYVGGRLVPELLDAGYRVRAIARNPTRLRGRPWYDQVDVVAADAADPDQIAAALEAVDIAYYLIHSLGTGRRFEARDRRSALTFGRAAREAGVGRIVYLGGLFPEGEDLSPHLESRKEVGEILLASGVPTTVLRAAVILGSGSASFEMMRYLTERLPAMTTPRWVDNRTQPKALCVAQSIRPWVAWVWSMPQTSGFPGVGVNTRLSQHRASVAAPPSPLNRWPGV